MSMAKETLSTKIATLTERVNNLIETSKDSRKEILNTVSALCDKVNHQHTEMEKRVRNLENKDIEEVSMYKGRIQLLKWISISLGIATSLITILGVMGLIGG